MARHVTSRLTRRGPREVNMTKNRVISMFFRVVAVLGLLLSTIPLSATPPVALAATTTNLRLRVESARQWIPSGLNKGDAIPKYHWLVVQDDTGDPTHYGTALGATDIHNSDYACKP